MQRRSHGRADTPPVPEGGGAFSAATRAWFDGAFAGATAAQAGAWDAIATGQHALVVAPTGSGKTLAAFLWSLDRLAVDAAAGRPRAALPGPLRLAAQGARRRRRAQPARAADRHPARGRSGSGCRPPTITVGVRSGDTPAAERRAARHARPPDILITTPESLFLMLTSAAREALRGVETVIVDEVHAVAGTKRGAHLALSLERLDALLDAPGPADRAVGDRPPGRGGRPLPRRRGRPGRGRPAAVRQDGSTSASSSRSRTSTALRGASPAATAGRAGDASIWPHVEERIVDLIAAHRSTIVFANSRRLAERLCRPAQRDRRASAPTGAPRRACSARPGADHGAVRRSPAAPRRCSPAPTTARSRKEQRALIEEDLKSGRLPAVVATSQPGARHRHGRGRPGDPGRVAAVGGQRAAAGRPRRPPGRRGLPRRALPQAPRRPACRRAVAAERMRAGADRGAARARATRSTCWPSRSSRMVALDAVDVDELARRWSGAARRSPTLPASALRRRRSTCSPGRYPSDEFAELRPRLVWDRVDRHAHRPARRAAAGRHLRRHHPRPRAVRRLPGRRPNGRPRVGELDEEMVYESRVGDVFALGATSPGGSRTSPTTGCWSPRARASPAGCRSGRATPLGRPAELGAGDRRVRPRARRRWPTTAARARAPQPGSTTGPPTTCWPTCDEQREATGHAARTTARSWSSGSATSSATGGWSCTRPFGAPGARARGRWRSARRLRERYGIDAQVDARRRRHRAAAARHRRRAPPGADAGRLRPRRDRAARHRRGRRLGAVRLPVPRVRRPRAAAAPPRPRPALAAVAAAPARRPAARRSPRKYPTFPIVLETVRECLQDVYDVPGAGRADAATSQPREVRLVEVETAAPVAVRARRCCSATSAPFLYEGDSPLAERRAAALSLDSTLLAELLGRAELRELLDPDGARRGRAPSCSGCRRTAAPATPRASPTCCGCSAR